MKQHAIWSSQIAVYPVWNVQVYLSLRSAALVQHDSMLVLNLSTDWSRNFTVFWLISLSCSITGHMPLCRCKVSACAQQISCYPRPGISWLKFWRQWEALWRPCPVAEKWQICCPVPTHTTALLLLTKNCAWLACLGRSVQSQKQIMNFTQAWQFCNYILVLRVKHEHLRCTQAWHLKSCIFHTTLRGTWCTGQDSQNDDHWLWYTGAAYNLLNVIAVALHQ